MDDSPLGSSVHGILQTGILEWVAIPFSRDIFHLFPVALWALGHCFCCQILEGKHLVCQITKRLINLQKRFAYIAESQEWQPTPVFLSGESQGQRSLVGCRLWGHKESNMTEVT